MIHGSFVFPFEVFLTHIVDALGQGVPPSHLQKFKVSKLHKIIQGTLRPAQQEAGAGLAQGKLGRQLRTGRALLALGRWGGAECLRRQQRLTRSSLARDVVTCLMIVLNSARGLCARDWARRALAPTPGASRSHAPKGALRRG